MSWRLKKVREMYQFFLYFTHSDLLQPNQSSVIFQSDWEGSEAAAARKFISPIAVFGEADGQKPLSLPHLLLKEWIVCLSYLFSGLAWPKSSKKKIQSSLLTHSHFPLLETLISYRTIFIGSFQTLKIRFNCQLNFLVNSLFPVSLFWDYA